MMSSLRQRLGRLCAGTSWRQPSRTPRGSLALVPLWWCQGSSASLFQGSRGHGGRAGRLWVCGRVWGTLGEPQACDAPGASLPTPPHPGVCCGLSHVLWPLWDGAPSGRGSHPSRPPE